MSDVQDHYSNLLAKHYTWMFGPSFPAKVAEQKAILKNALDPSAGAHDLGMAVDLGSGSGFQTIALAEMGYSPVLAVDTSEYLLKEMQSQRSDWPVQAICGD